MMISIIIACLNARHKLIETLESIKTQTFLDYEVIIKDGISNDDTITIFYEWLEKQNLTLAEKIHLFEEKDTSIYDGMNQAVDHARGNFVYFLNCGDFLSERNCLQYFVDGMKKMKEPCIYYGNVYDQIREVKVQSNPNIDAFACYRNVPCHQSCVYDKSLFEQRGYYTSYKVRADYEHFLYCFFTLKAKMNYIDVTLACYEGGGFSETPENIKKSKKEHAEIIAKYMTKVQIVKYNTIMILTLQPFRTFLAESKVFGKLYQHLKMQLYKKK